MIDYLKKSNFQLVLILVLALVMVHPLIYWGDLRDASSLPRYALLGILSSLGLFIWIIASYRNQLSISIHNIYYPIMVFILWSTLSLLWSIDPNNSIIELFQFSGLIIFAFLISQIITSQLLILIASISIFSASVVSIIGIQQYFFFNPFNFVQYSQPASTFTVTNFVSNYLDLIVPVAFMLFITATRRNMKWIYSFCFCVCLSFLILSRTRGSWLGLLFALIVLMFILYKNNEIRKFIFSRINERKLLLIAILIVPFVLLYVPGGVHKTSYSKLKYDESTDIRLIAYTNSLAMIKDRPILGTGIGGFRVGFRSYMFALLPLKKTHEDLYLLRLLNDPLQFIVELGIPVGLLIIFIAIFLMLLIWRVIKKEKNNTFQLIYIGIFLALIANGIHSLVAFPLHKPSSAIQVSIWIGAFVGLNFEYIKYKNIEFNKSILILGVITALFFLMINVLFYSKYIESSIYLSKALVSYNAKECEQSKKYIVLSNSIFGLDFNSRSTLVKIYSFCKSNLVDKLRVMNAAIKNDPTNTRALLTRGNMFLSMHKLNEARADFEDVIRILPLRSSGYIGLGNVALLKSNVSDAVKYFTKALYNTKDSKEVNKKERLKIKAVLKKLQSINK